MGYYILQICIISNLASALTASAKLFYHLPFILCHESLPVSHLSIWSWNPWSWNPLRYHIMWGVTTQDSASKSNTDWVIDLKKNPEICSLATFLLSIFDILHHTVRTFTTFWTTISHSSCVDTQ